MVDLCLVELPNPALESPKMYMPLGNLYLAAAAEQAGFKVAIADFRARVEALPEAKFYGFSCTTPQITTAKRLAKNIKGKTIIGGPHPSLLPQDCIGHFDYVVRGEGEEVLPQILAGTIEEGLVVAPRIKDLNSLGLPAWDMVAEPFSYELFDGERYQGVTRGYLSSGILTSRGCPYSCSFCGNIYRTPVIYRTPSNVTAELFRLREHRIHYLRFVDDNFTLHPHLDAICDTLGILEMRYRCHTRSDLMTSHMAKVLAESGCEECSLGIESADDRVLKINHKNETVDQHYQAINLLKDVGIRVKFYWMSGLPGETDKTIDLNMAFMARTKPEKWTLSTFTPYPGCAVFKDPDKYDVEIINPRWENWWNFVFNHDRPMEGREGYVHLLKGQTLDQMKARHDRFYQYLRGNSWQKKS